MMAKQQCYLFYSLVLLHSFYYATSSPVQNMKKQPQDIVKFIEVNKSEDLVKSNDTTVDKVTQPPPLPLPPVLHDVDNNLRAKRAIDANQGSSWLKYVWRERKYKIPQMFLTTIRNLWAVDPAGGRHLFEAGVPYGSVYLLKTLVLDAIFPRIGKNQ